MELSAINIFPIKSMGGISLSEAVVEDRGLRFDRRWMLVDENWKFLTQREFPVMATIHPEIYNGGVRVRKGVEWMEVPGEPDKGEYGVAAIWASWVDVVAYVGAVSEWFSDSIGTKCRLVMLPSSSRRPVNEKYAVRPGKDVVSLADGYPFMLLSEASLADLNSQLDEPVPMNRFRPNFVVTGSDAFEDDEWRKIRIGETTFYIVKPCERCIIPTVDQVTGKKGKEPLKTLASYRTVEGKVLFGQNLIADAPGATIAVGDSIEVLEVK